VKSVPVKLFHQALLYAVLLFLFVAAVGTTAHAVNNYYVSPSGSGTACSQANPCGSIAQAQSTLTLGASGSCTAAGGWLTVSNVGACVHVLSGGYGSVGKTSKSGTSTQKIVFISDVRWGAKITNPNWTQNGSYSEIDGFEMTAPTNTSIIVMQSGNHRGVQYNYIHDVNVNNCTPNGVIHETTAPSDHDYINGNIIHHFGLKGCSGQSFHGIYADGAAVQITNNIISGGTGGWAIQKQYASMTDCTPGVISNNTIFNNAGGIVINEENNGHCTFSNWSVVNNIIVNNGIAGTGGGGGSSFGIDYYNLKGSNNLVSNNLMYGNLPSNFGNHGSACTPGASNCPSTNLKSDASTGATFANFKTDTNAAPASGYSADDYQIKPGSNAIQNGTRNCAASGLSPCVASLDIMRTDRMSGSTLDIGAYEQGSLAGVPSAPTGLAALVK
jgi:hypothetical protein